MKKLFRVVLGFAILGLYSCGSTTTKVSSGEGYEVVDLPDGSVAFLNENSSIEYNGDFKDRYVEQSGEVFYEVEKGNTPFVVHTENGDVRVLGTKFNVKAEHEDFDVEVEEGTVEMKVGSQSKKVKKGQKAFFNKNKKSIETGVADMNHKKWMRQLKREFRRLGKKIKKGSKKFMDESEDVADDVKKGSKKFGKKLKAGFKKLTDK